ncbi:YhgE/Pip family protein [Cellulomonas taurus]|uniref:YhgE/Pip family protein n=1 Tax=Cellulomonas taurus TaxID=2729175 RepID=UPI00145D0CD1|nr:YhgE/Pip domain-containing protein [Cellulomonas taurus]
MFSFLTGTELRRFRRGVLPKLAIVAMICIPLLYGALYLWAYWDPTGNLDRLPVALVNADTGATTDDGERLTAGDDVVDELVDSDALDWRQTDATDAAAGVKDGTYYFAVTIPAEFSTDIASASGDDPVPAQLQVTYNDANSYLASTLGRSAMTQIRAAVSSTIGEQAVDQVLVGLGSARDGFAQASDGALTLNAAAGDLSSGAHQVADGASSAAEGAKKLSTGATTLANGTGQLADGTGKLADGTGRLANGTQQLADGTGQLADGTAQLADGTMQLADGSQRLSDGAAQLSTGIGTAASGATTLAQKSVELSDGAGTAASSAATLAGGAQQLSDGVDQLAATLGPVAAALPDVSTGLSDLGSQLLALADRTEAGGDTATADALRTAVADVQQTTEPLTSATLDPSALATLVDGAHQVRDGSAQLSTGLGTLSSGASQLSTGAQQLADGTGTAASAAATVAEGAATLDGKIDLLSSSTGTLNAKVGTLDSSVDTLNSSAGTLNSSMGTLDSKVGTLDSGAQELASGAATLADGTSTLADGSAQLADGSDQMIDGSQQLADKLSDGAAQLPNDDEATRTQRADTIATPVRADDRDVASSATMGEGFAPFFIPLALFVGGLITWLLLRPLPNRALATPVAGWRIALSGYAPALLIGVAQVAVLLAVVHLGLGLSWSTAIGTFAFTVLVAAAFLAVQQMLTAVLGSAAGKVAIIALLMIQLTSASGTYPVETTPEIFRAMHPYLPMTYAITGLRELLTGGTEGRLWWSVVVLIAFTVGSLAVTAWRAGRMRTWTLSRLHPALTI